MIEEVGPKNREQFLAAVRGTPYFGDVLPVHLAVFGQLSALMRFYVANGTAAVQLKGQSAMLCGTYDTAEMGACLRMHCIRSVNVSGEVPDGYRRLYPLHNLMLKTVCVPLCPAVTGLALDGAPSPAKITDFMMRGEKDTSAWANFYSELCTKLSRGAAEVWAVCRSGEIVSTAGAYAMSEDTAYLAAVETHERLRGQGIGGWLVGMLAAELTARGCRVALSCREERLNFYKRIGFVQENIVWHCVPEKSE